MLFVVGLVAIQVNCKEIFRYEDSDSKQLHYMEGEPGNAVNGGWEFVAPEGVNYELNYIADGNGFQPQGDYLPVHVDDTEDVKKAKVQFYKAFDETDAKLKSLNTKRVEREAVDTPSHYAPFYGYFPRHLAQEPKLSKEEVEKVQMEMKSIHEKYMEVRKEKLQMLAKNSPYHYPYMYYYPEHLVPDTKISEEELEKIHSEMKEADKKYMDDMKVQMDTLAEDFPYYPNFYPKITHFPVKENNDVEGENEDQKEPMMSKFRPFYYNFPQYYTYSHGMKDGADMKKDSQLPHPYPYFSHYYGHPKHAMPEAAEGKMEMEDVAVEATEDSRKKRDVTRPVFTYASYPRLISPSYYPSYYPLSAAYHPSVAHVTRTVVKLDDVADNAIDGAEAVITAQTEDADAVSESDVEPEAEAEAEQEAEPVVEDEPDSQPESQPESSVEVSGADAKLTEVKPIVANRPLYYPIQGVLHPSVANARPAFHPFWSTRFVQTGFNYLPRFTYAPYSNGKSVYSTFPVKEKDMKLAAIVA